jgi:exodeoxyribonuclease VII small subunit
MAKKKKSLSGKENSFEYSYKRLEEILDKLENEVNDASLDEIINYYQEGLKLLKICRKKLSETELQIEKINTEEIN